MISAEMCGGKFRPSAGCLRLLHYVGDAFISFHADSTSISFDTPIRNQLAVAIPDDGEVAASEVVFTNKRIASGHHELGCPPEAACKVYSRPSNKATHMAVDCLASGSCKYLMDTWPNPMRHSACSTGGWVLFIWPSKPWL